MEKIIKCMKEIMEEYGKLEGKEKMIVWSILDDFTTDFQSKGGWGDDLEPEDFDEYDLDDEVKHIQEKYNLPMQKKHIFERPYDVDYDEPDDDNTLVIED